MKRIGIIDSGVGGLTILRQLLNKNLNAQFFYISDEKNVPYGNKPQSFMFKQMLSMTNKLIAQDVDGILIACNTATAKTIDKLRNSFEVPFIGIEPYLNYINKQNSKDKKVGLILTEATYNSTRFQNLVKKTDPKGTIKVFPLKNLASSIEQLKYEKFENLKEKISSELTPLMNQDFDILLLGCTHYPIISNYIESFLQLKTVDPSISVIDRLVTALDLKKTNKSNQTFLYNSNNTDDWVYTNINILKFL